MNKNILFIGANGYMGHGMSLNLLKQNNLYVIANRQRNNIAKLITEGAKEINSYEEIKNLNLDCLMLCVTNTPIAIEIALDQKLAQYDPHIDGVDFFVDVEAVAEIVQSDTNEILSKIK